MKALQRFRAGERLGLEPHRLFPGDWHRISTKPGKGARNCNPSPFWSHSPGSESRLKHGGLAARALESFPGEPESSREGLAYLVEDLDSPWEKSSNF
ncbi:MAG: hypothetical protein IOC63_07985 [Methylobacterium sp.]|nr:hypothetical protein [Methylobacterium sp.]